jgi:hypothetical protein
MFSLVHPLFSLGSVEDRSSWLIGTMARSEPLERAHPHFCFGPSRIGLVPFRTEALQRSPGSRARCVSACSGFPTMQDRPFHPESM